jgi:hypothetical protein
VLLLRAVLAALLIKLLPWLAAGGAAVHLSLLELASTVRKLLLRLTLRLAVCLSLMPKCGSAAGGVALGCAALLRLA